jgi:hypothetical protein
MGARKQNIKLSLTVQEKITQMVVRADELNIKLRDNYG